MKKIFFLFALLASMTASATVTVTPLSADYYTKKVTFRVSWTGTPYNDLVWVWVDLCPVTGTSPGTFAKAVISGAIADAGSIQTVYGNTRGFYVTTNPSTVTATLSNATGKFNWCAYGSDYPPNATPKIGGGYDLHGTPPFIINGATLPQSSTTYGASITTITDLSDNPNGIVAKQTEPVSSCALPSYPYAGSFADFPATYSAGTAVSLMDARDRKIYNAVKIGDRWWMAQNLNYQQGLIYLDKYSASSTTIDDPTWRSTFWCPTNSEDPVPRYACDYWGALYMGVTALMLDGVGTWTEVSGSYCTTTANTDECKINHGRSAKNGVSSGGRGICPPNWHVPTVFEWATMLDHVEGSGSEKATTSTVWNNFIYTSAADKLRSDCFGEPKLNDVLHDWTNKANNESQLRVIGAWIYDKDLDDDSHHLGTSVNVLSSSIGAENYNVTFGFTSDAGAVWRGNGRCGRCYGVVRCIRD